MNSNRTLGGFVHEKLQFRKEELHPGFCCTVHFKVVPKLSDAEVGHLYGKCMIHELYGIQGQAVHAISQGLAVSTGAQGTSHRVFMDCTL